MNINKASKDMNKKIDVSIIVPMYNVENLIHETIQSLKQNNCNFEVLLIDDGSADATVSRAQEAIGQDRRFKIISKPNSGVSATRNLGIERAAGEYIVFSDSDDIWTEHAIDKLLTAAQKHEADLVYGGIKKFNSTKTWTIPVHDKHNLVSEGYKSIVKNPELFFSMGPVAKLIHKSLLENNKFPENIYCAEDQVVCFNIFTHVKNIYCIGEHIYYYRERDIAQNEKSITQQRDIKAFDYLKDIISVMEIIKNNLIQNPNLPEAAKKETLRKYYERALTFDVWPLFIRVLKHHPHKTEDALNTISNFINKLDEDFFNHVAGFRYFFLRMLIDYIDFIKIKHFSAYRVFITSIINRLTKKTREACNKNWDKRWKDNCYIAFSSLSSSFAYFIYLRNKKRISRFLNKNHEKIIKTYIFPLYRLLPIQKNKIVFATSTKGRASNNFTVLLNELKKDGHYNIKKFLGLSNEFKRNLSRYFHLATAGTIVLESYYRPLYGLQLNKKTKVVQVWHACGAFKKFGFSAIGQLDANSYEFETAAHSFYTHIITSSETTSQLYAEAFNAPAEKTFALGVPRTDIFFSTWKMNKIKNEILKKYPNLKKSKNILYAPTFRGSPSERKKFTFLFSFDFLAKIPKDHNLIIKLHPVVNIENIEIPDSYKERIILLPSTEDVNDWMIFADILVTDYSSLIFEYAFLDKPIVFYVPDLEEYFSERGFYFNFNEYAYGSIAKNETELVSSILNARHDLQFFQPQKAKFIDRFIGSCNGKSAYNIVQKIIKS